MSIHMFVSTILTEEKKGFAENFCPYGCRSILIKFCICHEAVNSKPTVQIQTFDKFNFVRKNCGSDKFDDIKKKKIQG